MEHVTIVSVEQCTAGATAPILIVGGIITVTLLSSLVALFFVKDLDKLAKFVVYYGTISLCVLFVTAIICSFFRHPVDRYKYVVTIDKDNMSIIQYEEFMDKYHPVEKDGKYYFEGKYEEWME